MMRIMFDSQQTGLKISFLFGYFRSIQYDKYLRGELDTST